MNRIIKKYHCTAPFLHAQKMASSKQVFSFRLAPRKRRTYGIELQPTYSRHATDGLTLTSVTEIVGLFVTTAVPSESWLILQADQQVGGTQSRGSRAGTKKYFKRGEIFKVTRIVKFSLKKIKKQNNGETIWGPGNVRAQGFINSKEIGEEKTLRSGTSLVVQGLRLHLPMQGVLV